MKAILDTSVVIALDVAEIPEETAISAGTLAELHFGVHLARDARARRLRLRRLTEIESRFDPIPVDAAVARAYGELASLTVAGGRKVRTRVMDLLIAATAHAHGVPLYTRDPEDFEHLAELVEVRGV